MLNGIGILVVAHAPLASAFARVASDMGLPVSCLAVLDMTPDMTREQACARAITLVDDLRCEECLVLADLGGGCSPAIVAQELGHALKPKARIVTDLNVAMLATALCWASQLPRVDQLAQRVVARKTPRQLPALPTWLASNRAVQSGTASPLERFIAAYEPADAGLQAEFRTELAAALASSAELEPARLAAQGGMA